MFCEDKLQTTHVNCIFFVFYRCKFYFIWCKNQINLSIYSLLFPCHLKFIFIYRHVRAAHVFLVVILKISLSSGLAERKENKVAPNSIFQNWLAFADLLELFHGQSRADALCQHATAGALRPSWGGGRVVPRAEDQARLALMWNLWHHGGLVLCCVLAFAWAPTWTFFSRT